MERIFTEENNVYQIDCTRAKWATNQLHHEYHASGVHLSDVDFLIEDADHLLMVEYKNAKIGNAAKPDAYDPNQEKNLNKLVKKFYDSLHYLHLLGKVRPVQYICVLEYPAGDPVNRRRLRNSMKKELPFQLQKNLGRGTTLINDIKVLSIQEWNEDCIYGKYPISPLETKGK